jgi:hypothetical protein
MRYKHLLHLPGDPVSMSVTLHASSGQELVATDAARDDAGQDFGSSPQTAAACRGSTNERRRATTGNTDAHAHLDRGWRPRHRRGHLG